MNCPHCQRDLPLKFISEECPFCGHVILESEVHEQESRPKPVKTWWPLFFIAMFGPAGLTILAVLLDGTKRGDVEVWIGLYGGIIGGIICGVMLGRHLGKSFGTRIIIGIFFSFLMIVVCVGINCFGCTASGFHFLG
jgi:hypothetical protein